MAGAGIVADVFGAGQTIVEQLNGDLRTFGRVEVITESPASGSPAPTGLSEDCVALLGATRKWNDDQCGSSKPYVCETQRAPGSTQGDACRPLPDGGIP